MLKVNGQVIGWVAKKTQGGKNVVVKPNAPHKLLDPYVASRAPRTLSLEVSCENVQAAMTTLNGLITGSTTLTFNDPDYKLFNNCNTVVGTLAPYTPTDECKGVGNFTLEITVVSWV